MASDLHRSEPGTQGVRRIARAHVAQALESLERKSPSDEDIHTARKELKRARATLRLLREAIGDTAYRRTNATLRDTARPLSRIRDGKVQLDTLERLVGRFASLDATEPVEDLRRILKRERTQVRRSSLKSATRLGALRKSLRDTHERIGRWRLDSKGWSVVGAGLKSVYSKGRKAFHAAVKDRSTDKLHEWRKQVKYLWHQLQLLEPLWPGPVGELADQAHQLADYLGDDHDLSVLREKALQLRVAFPNASARAALLASIDRRSTELRDKAVVLGRRLYEERPAAFAARLGQYWRDWQRKL
jgi:CHAD domain-containing protein